MTALTINQEADMEHDQARKLAETPCRVLFLTGVGLVFPYIRSHSVLENLQSVTRQTPTVLFFQSC